jgi:hypothetical protein
MERQRMTTRYLICAGLVFISSLGWSESKDVITVAGFEIPGVMEPKLTGSYDQILVEVFSHLPSKVKYFVIPTARADSLFSDNAVDCVAPMDIRYSKIQEMVVNSKPINIAKIYIYSRTKKARGRLSKISRASALESRMVFGMVPSGQTKRCMSKPSQAMNKILKSSRRVALMLFLHTCQI